MKTLSVLILLCANLAAGDALVDSSYCIKVSHSGDPEIHGWGSGIHVDLNDYGMKENRYVLTASHVIGEDDADSVAAVVVVVAGKDIKCTIVKNDGDFDVCLLKAESDLPTPGIKIAKALPPNGASVSNVSYPKSVGPQTFKGVYLTVTGSNVPKLLLVAVIPEFDLGSSGSGVFYNDTLIGIGTCIMTTEKNKKTGFMGFLPVKRLIQFLTYKD